MTKDERIADLEDEISRLKDENNRAWRERNEAYAKVKGWEATVYVEKLPLRAVQINDWGPGGEGQTAIPEITPRKLTELLDELAELRAANERMRASR
jgi:hypothetical protein